MEGRVPLSKIGAVAKEGRTRAIASLRKVTVLDKCGEREWVNACLEGMGQLVKFGAAFLIRDGAVDEAEVMSDATVEFAEGGDGAAITTATKGTVQPGKLRSVVRVGGGEFVVLPYLGAEHGETFRVSIAGAKADTGIDVASQATPPGLGVGEESREGRWRGGKAGVVRAKLILRRESEGGDNVVMGGALSETEGGARTGWGCRWEQVTLRQGNRQEGRRRRQPLGG